MHRPNQSSAFRPELPPFPARLVLSAAMVLAVALLPACSSSGRLRFQPNPLDVRIASREAGPVLARALLSVREIRSIPSAAPGAADAPASQGRHLELVLRLRVDNESGATLTLCPEDMVLVDAGLSAFPPPRIVVLDERVLAPGESAAVPAGSSAVFELGFAFADRGELDLDGLNLSWSVELGGERHELSSSFERVLRSFPEYGYRYYDCHPFFGWHHHPYYYSYYGAFRYRH